MHVNRVYDGDMWVDPVISLDQAEIDHIRLVFLQIRVENLKRGPPGFQGFFVLMSSGLRTNHSA